MAYLVHFGRRGEEDNVLDGREYPMTDIEHSGTKEHSGRYKWGSGNRPFQRLEKSLQEQRARAKNYNEAKRNLKLSKLKYKDLKKSKRLLTDDEIRNTINRLKLEKELSQLIDENTSPKKAGIKDALAKAGSQAVQNAGKDLMTKTIYWTVGNAINSADGNSYAKMPSLSEYLFGKNSAETKTNDLRMVEKNVKNVLKSLGVNEKKTNKMVNEVLNVTKLDKALNANGMDKDQRSKLIEAIFDTTDSSKTDAVVGKVSSIFDTYKIKEDVKNEKLKEIKLTSELNDAFGELNLPKEQRQKLVKDILDSVTFTDKKEE